MTTCQFAEIENRYRQLESAGRAVDYAGRSFEHFDLRDFLDECLPQLEFVRRPPRVLEYGTGTGPGACYLAARGYCVDAIDRSPTAIAMARRFAAERGLDIRFAACDVGDFAAADASYDMVIDSFCLHRIIADADRARLMSKVRRLLAKGGYYLVGSVVLRAGRDYGQERLDPATGVVYSELAIDATGAADAVELDGRLYFARHRHVSAAFLRGELESAGFAVLKQDSGGGRVLCVRS